MKADNGEDRVRVRALTLWQPWASLVALGEKQFETRSWRPPDKLVGGLLAIHAAAKMPDWRKLVSPLSEASILDCLTDHGLLDDELPLGQVLCLCQVDSVERTENCSSVPYQAPVRIMWRERDLGNWEPGRFAWRLTVLDRFEPGEPANGGQRLWTWEFPERQA